MVPVVWVCLREFCEWRRKKRSGPPSSPLNKINCWGKCVSVSFLCHWRVALSFVHCQERWSASPTELFAQKKDILPSVIRVTQMPHDFVQPKNKHSSAQHHAFVREDQASQVCLRRSARARGVNPPPSVELPLPLSTTTSPPNLYCYFLAFLYLFCLILPVFLC